MPVNESTLPTQGTETENSNTTSPLSLNDIFRESMKKAQAQTGNLEVIVRCENLPQIQGNYNQMVELFDNLLSMILNHSPIGSRLFLYIDCEEDAERSTEKEKHFLIRFNTNIAAAENWKVINSQALINCKQILSAHNGSLVVNNISSAGCLFIVSLLAKTE